MLWVLVLVVNSNTLASNRSTIINIGCIKKYMTSCYLVIILPKLIEFGQAGQCTWSIWLIFGKNLVKFFKVMKFNSKNAENTNNFLPTNQ